MSICNWTPSQDLANRNKANSDINDSTGELTIKRSMTNSSHGIAAQCVRNLKDDAEIERLRIQTDEDYFNDLLAIY